MRIEPFVIKQPGLDLGGDERIVAASAEGTWGGDQEFVLHFHDVWNGLDDSFDLIARVVIRDFSGQQGAAVVTGDIDMGVAAMRFTDAAASAQLDFFVHEEGAAGAAVFGHQNASARANGNDRYAPGHG